LLQQEKQHAHEKEMQPQKLQQEKNQGQDVNVVHLQEKLQGEDVNVVHLQEKLQGEELPEEEEEDARTSLFFILFWYELFILLIIYIQYVEASTFLYQRLSLQYLRRYMEVNKPRC